MSWGVASLRLLGMVGEYRVDLRRPVEFPRNVPFTTTVYERIIFEPDEPHL